MNDRDREIFNKLRSIGQKNEVKVDALVDIKGGSRRISFDRIEKNDYKIQVLLPYDFDVYESIRSDICILMNEYDAVLQDEHDFGDYSIKIHKELIFFDKEKHETLRRQLEEEKKQQGRTIVNIRDNATTGSINTGNAEQIDNSTNNNLQMTQSGFKKQLLKKQLHLFLA